MPTASWYSPLRRQRPPSPSKPPATQTTSPSTLPHSPSNGRDQAGSFPSQASAAIPISRSKSRSRAPSLQSCSSSFILTTPTSPLVRETRNDDVKPSSLDLAGSPSRVQRRHTFSPQTLQALTSRNLRQFSTPAQVARQPPSALQDSTATYHRHHARRSLTSGVQYSAHSTPQTPTFSASRRPSFSSDASPSLRASMVGSYEESILRGRMSTTPSKPLEFTAQIGVLGKGDCKPKHPPHVTVEFPAVYYEYNAGTGHTGRIDNEPSPYVGFIDLERSLPPAQVKERRRRRRESPSKIEANDLEDVRTSNLSSQAPTIESPPPAISQIPKGGSYRIPQHGQLQILIKSPSKTAVKLFLVPYDLSEMRAGTKTFVRQRCYSTGPVVENPITSQTPSEAVSVSVSSGNKAKPSLRYLIQLNICCPSRGRFFLYKSIHVVFANRVLDNKEGLQSEILWPEPRYTPFKPVGEISLPGSASLADAIAVRTQRRRSYGGPSAVSTGFSVPRESRVAAQSEQASVCSPTPPVPSLPFEYCPANRESPFEAQAPQGGGADLEMSDPISPGTDSQATKKTHGSPHSSMDGVDDGSIRGHGVDLFRKRSREDDRLGGIFGRPGTPEPGEGLLARRLRNFGLETARKSSDTVADTP